MNNKQILRPVYLLLIISFALAGLKLWVGFWLDSSALRSVGFNNATDFLYGFVLFLGLWVSIQPPDANHPEGHHRFESLVGIFVGGIITLSGLYVLYDAGWTFHYGREITINPTGMVVIFGSMAIKAVFSWHCIREGRRLQSPAVKAIGRDQTSDILADLTVLAALLAVYFGWRLLDPLVALAMAFAIAKVGVGTLLENIDHLTGRVAPSDLEEKVINIVAADDSFSGPSGIKTHFDGPRVYISLVVETDSSRSLGGVHRAEENLKEKIMDLDRVGRIHVHVEPKKTG